MGSSKSVTVGYKYSLGMHMIICHGPVDAITKIIAGENLAWTGNVTGNQQITIDAPELFGGKMKEGGIQGKVDFMMGGATQGRNDYLTSQLGSVVPAFRGVVSAVLRKVYLCAMSPYPKAWAFLVKRCPARDWYPATADIGGGANGAHIIYEVLTNPQWGMGYATDTIDDASFREVALTLFNENLGLSFELTSTDSIENFIYTVVQHINGMFYSKPDTGKFALKLLRDNYVTGDLPSYNEDNITKLESFERPSYAEIVNEVVLTYRPQGTRKDDTVTVQDLAAIHAQEGVISQAINYPGIDNATNAARVAMRELRQKSTPLARVKMSVLRSAWNTAIGDCVKFSWAEHGVTNMVLRVLGVDLGNLDEGEITITGIEDVFGLPNSTYIGDQPSGWVDPIPTPVASSVRKVMEVPYWEIVRSLEQADFAYLTNTSCFLMASAIKPTGAYTNFELWSLPTGGSYSKEATGQFCEYGTTDGTHSKTATIIQMSLLSPDSSEVTLGSYGVWENEIVRIDAINMTTKRVTVGRGCLDTVPAEHLTGTTLLFVDSDAAYDTTEYSTGETLKGKILTRTGKGVLPLATADEDNVIMAGRFIRPYPPAQFKIEGSYFPTDFTSTDGSLHITWAHRNRVQQTATILDFDDAGVTNETGVTYSLLIKRVSNGATLISLTNLTITSAAVALPSGTYNINIELFSVRDGYECFQRQSHRMTFTHFGATRITEAGDTRITEAGDTRVVE